MLPTWLLSFIGWKQEQDTLVECDEHIDAAKMLTTPYLDAAKTLHKRGILPEPLIRWKTKLIN